MFQLQSKEFDSLRSQFVTSNNANSRGGRRYLPFVFTENGVAMLSAVLRSEKAVKISIAIIREADNEAMRLLVDFGVNPAIEMTGDELIDLTTRSILNKYRAAFEEPAKEALFHPLCLRPFL